MRTSIWPRLEAAAVCTIALCPSRVMVSTKPSAVSGLTKADAPCSAVTRSDERRVGKERVSTCRYRWWQYHYKKKKHTNSAQQHRQQTKRQKIMQVKNKN